MTNGIHNSAGEDSSSPARYLYQIFDSLSFPVCVINRNGELIDRNTEFRNLFESEESSIRLDWSHPFSPEYRKRIAVSYLRALRGYDRRCFAVMKTSSGDSLPVEIYLFPLRSEGEVSSILAFLKVVDNRMISFDKSTSLLLEETDTTTVPIYDYAPFPIIRLSRQGEVLYASSSLETFTGYTFNELLKKRDILAGMVSHYTYEKIRRAALYILHGKAPFKRINDVKVLAKGDMEKWMNLTVYPVMRNNEVVAIEMVAEDVTRIKRLEERIGLLNRIQIVGDLTKGLLHSFNNLINIIMSRTQLLLQITEKDAVTDGLRVIEKTANEGVKQVRRIEEFIGEGERLNENEEENLIDIIEDAIEFAKIQFKVEEKEKRRFIKIARKYYARFIVHTDVRLMRELLLSVIFKVAGHIVREGLLQVEFKDNGSPCLKVTVGKKDEPAADTGPQENLYSEIDIRRVAEKINVKIIEEESPTEYSIQAVIPSSIVIKKDRVEAGDSAVKVRDMDVVIVEDERELKDILFELFNRMGNRVQVFENGEEALEEMKGGKCDLLITDYQISGITGLELAARIKELDENIVTVLLSGWMLNDLKAYKNVVDLYYPKPFKLDMLITGIAKLLSGRRKEK